MDKVKNNESILRIFRNKISYSFEELNNLRIFKFNSFLKKLYF